MDIDYFESPWFQAYTQKKEETKRVHQVTVILAVGLRSELQRFERGHHLWRIEFAWETDMEQTHCRCY